jgi:hypothetical protein
MLSNDVKFVHFRPVPIMLGPFHDPVSEDDVLDKIPGVKRIKISKALLSDPLSADNFQNCCCIFDHIDVLSDKKVREEVLKIKCKPDFRDWSTFSDNGYLYQSLGYQRQRHAAYFK